MRPATAEDRIAGQAWVFMLLILSAFASSVAHAAPSEAAERFTHFAGVNLAELPSFDDLSKLFGPSPVRRTGDAANADARVCYRTTNGNAVVEFFHGEVNWGFVYRTPKVTDSNCPKTVAIGSDQLHVAGVELNMSKEGYKGLTGPPQKETSILVRHEFQYVHVLTDSELATEVDRGRKTGYPTEDPESLRRWDVGISLVARFSRGHLYSFTVDRVETN